MAFAMISCFVYKINWGVRRNLDSLAFSWEQRKLNEITDVRDGTHDSPKYVQEGHPFITSKNVSNGFINYDDVQYVTDEDYEKINKRSKVDVHDILMGMIGTIGNLALIRKKPDFAIKNIALIKYTGDIEYKYLYQALQADCVTSQLSTGMDGGTQKFVSLKKIRELDIPFPEECEQKKIGTYFSNIDTLITLHQRKHYLILEDIMLNNINKMDLFYDYYAQWITVYKEGAIRKVTMDKYLLTQSWIKQLAPELRVCELSRITYQKLLNDYAKSHERQTTMDFHHQLKGAVLDAVDEGLIERDPTRKAIIKGKKPRHKKIKYLNQFELHKLLSNLDLGQEINWDWFILLVAKTGMRFSEALAITPKDFDFSKQSLSINKTWDYKGEGGFMPTKNQSSIRKIQIDWQLIIQFSTLVKDLPEDEPIFVSGKVYNSTVNDILERHCKKAEIPVISIHGLRHTHASLLLFAGVSIASVAQRLGHSSMTTTQKTYLHIIQELENKDVDLVMRSLSSLN